MVLFPSVLGVGILLAGPVPDDLREAWVLSPFYEQCVHVGPVPIVASSQVHPIALKEAAWIVDQMIGHRPDILEAMAARRTRLAIMAVAEFTTDLPEHRDLYPRTWWDVRARGLGATEIRPAVSCGEENLLALEGDPYSTENILIHEFAHAIHEMGLAEVDETFDRRLDRTYVAAMADGLWAGTYAATNRHEYWAEGVQSWFDTNRADDAQHNNVDTRSELKAYDPRLAALCAEVFTDGPWRYINPRRRLPGAPGTAHLATFDRTNGRAFRWDLQRQSAYAAENRRRADTLRQPDESMESWLRRRIEEGCPEAMVALGRRYRDGDGVQQSHALARKWYDRAVTTGYIPAHDHLGWLLWAGDPDVRDRERAISLLEHAARNGHVQAMLNLARFDPNRAQTWLRMAARQGHPRALEQLRRNQEETPTS